MSAAMVLELARLWALIGCAVAAVLVLWGAGRAEPNAREAWAFRLLLIPGAILLWPLVAWRLVARLRGAAPGVEAHRPPRRAQDLAALALALFLPLALGTAVVIREDGPRDAAPVRLDTPTPDAAQEATE